MVCAKSGGQSASWSVHNLENDYMIILCETEFWDKEKFWANEETFWFYQVNQSH